jgi:hypothetical protein
LLVAELELRETTARFGGVVVRNRSLEPLAERCRLRELAAQPPQQPDGVRARSGHGSILATRLSCVTPAPIV